MSDYKHDPFTNKKTKVLRPKVHMGGPVTKNGKDVSKNIERQTAAKYKRQEIARKMKATGKT